VSHSAVGVSGSRCAAEKAHAREHSREAILRCRLKSEDRPEFSRQEAATIFEGPYVRASVYRHEFRLIFGRMSAMECQRTFHPRGSFATSMDNSSFHITVIATTEERMPLYASPCERDATIIMQAVPRGFCSSYRSGEVMSPSACPSVHAHGCRTYTSVAHPARAAIYPRSTTYSRGWLSSHSSQGPAPIYKVLCMIW